MQQYPWNSMHLSEIAINIHIYTNILQFLHMSILIFTPIRTMIDILTSTEKQSCVYDKQSVDVDFIINY